MGFSLVFRMALTASTASSMSIIVSILKRSTPAFSKTTAAEIYAPYSWKGLLEGQNISELPAEVLTIVGARIPTEFLSSIDVFKIKGRYSDVKLLKEKYS